jgi:hypothetical protein
MFLFLFRGACCTRNEHRAYTSQRPSHTAPAHKNSEKVAITLGNNLGKRAPPMLAAADQPVITLEAFYRLMQSSVCPG